MPIRRKRSWKPAFSLRRRRRSHPGLEQIQSRAHHHRFRAFIHARRSRCRRQGPGLVEAVLLRRRPHQSHRPSIASSRRATSSPSTWPTTSASPPIPRRSTPSSAATPNSSARSISTASSKPSRSHARTAPRHRREVSRSLSRRPARSIAKSNGQREGELHP